MTFTTDSGIPVKALYTPGDGCAEPEKATSAIANAAFREGAAILERCAVRGLETSAGAVSGVVTDPRTLPGIEKPAAVGGGY